MRSVEEIRQAVHVRAGELRHRQARGQLLLSGGASGVLSVILLAVIGTCGDFEMSSKGCERGVYAGLFYYDNFILHSRTYDMGKTFHITAVNDY